LLKNFEVKKVNFDRVTNKYQNLQGAASKVVVSIYIQKLLDEERGREKKAR